MVKPPQFDSVRKSLKSPDRKKRGRPLEHHETFNFPVGDLIVKTEGGQIYTQTVITHKPTGITVTGHDEKHPGSEFAAKYKAMLLLKKAVAEHEAKEAE